MLPCEGISSSILHIFLSIAKELKQCLLFCMFRGINICIYWRYHMPPHFHGFYGSDEVVVYIEELEVLEGSMASKQLKMLLGWAAFH